MFIIGESFLIPCGVDGAWMDVLGSEGLGVGSPSPLSPKAV